MIFKNFILYDISNSSLNNRKKSSRNTVISSSFPIEWDLGFQQKQSSKIQLWELNSKLAQVFLCRERKGLYRETFHSATNEKFPSDLGLAEHFLFIHRNINPYLWVSNLQKPAGLRVLWGRALIPFLPVQLSDSLLLTSSFPPSPKGLLSPLKSFLACLLNLQSAHSGLRTLNLGMILHRVLWFQGWLISRRVLKPQQADWKLSKQAEEKLKIRSPSPATEAWKALYIIYCCKEVFSDFVMIYRLPFVIFYYFCSSYGPSKSKLGLLCTHLSTFISIIFSFKYREAGCRIACFSQKEQMPKNFK